MQAKWANTRTQNTRARRNARAKKEEVHTHMGAPSCRHAPGSTCGCMPGGEGVGRRVQAKRGACMHTLRACQGDARAIEPCGPEPVTSNSNSSSSSSSKTRVSQTLKMPQVPWTPEFAAMVAKPRVPETPQMPLTPWPNSVSGQVVAAAAVPAGAAAEASSSSSSSSSSSWQLVPAAAVPAWATGNWYQQAAAVAAAEH